jgi:hypothetical protein
MTKSMLLRCRCDGGECSCSDFHGEVSNVKIRLDGWTLRGQTFPRDEEVDVDDVVAAVLARIAAERK